MNSLPIINPVLSPLVEPTSLPLYPAAQVTNWGPTVVVAPHPDDESIGCGGAIALLRQRDIPVRVLFVSDGTGSHPTSRSHPPDVLRALREAEALAALALLGVRAEQTTFLREPDRFVPRDGSPGFDAAVGRVVEVLRGWIGSVAATILVPWRRDPHCDHRASWELIQAAVAATGLNVTVVEYPVWVSELGAPEDFPPAEEMHAWRLDISTVIAIKRAAITTHRSQTTDLIDDDPGGFRLTPRLLTRFTVPWEIFIEPIDRR